MHVELDTVSASSWPIAAAMLPFPPSQEAGPETWLPQLAEVAYEGFDLIDITDNWLPSGDLTTSEIEHLQGALAEAGLAVAAFSVIRRSVIDPEHGVENLAYTHRAIDNASAMGVTTVSLGLHRPLLEQQTRPLWFWAEPGPVDSQDDANWDLAAARIRELGRHAGELGIELSLEMYEDTLIGSAEGGVRLVSEVGLSNVGLNPDLGNMYRLHRDTEDFLAATALCAPVANYWHVKSYFRDEDRRGGWVTTTPAPMEIGSMNYREAIRMAIGQGFTGAFCAEHYGGDGLSVAARNAEYIRRMIAVALGEPMKQIRKGQ